MSGGGRSVALTILRLNSLLTGEKYSEFAKFLLSKIALLLSKSHILREKQPITCKSVSGIKQGRLQG
jgi:hypothetical protein